MVHIVLIDYGAGNLHSVASGFRRVMQESDTLTVTADPTALMDATHIVLPGVGAFGDCANALHHCTGMIEALEQYVLQKTIPFLGICVGMQLMLERGHEHGIHQGLGWIEGDVLPIPTTNHEGVQQRIPHMGWNELETRMTHPLCAALQQNTHAYFVHSYYAACKNADHMIATTRYGIEIPAIIGKDNLVGTQFHPEKSQKIGAMVLENFLKMR